MTSAGRGRQRTNQPAGDVTGRPDLMCFRADQEKMIFFVFYLFWWIVASVIIKIYLFLHLQSILILIGLCDIPTFQVICRFLIKEAGVLMSPL